MWRVQLQKYALAFVERFSRSFLTLFFGCVRGCCGRQGDILLNDFLLRFK